MKSKTFFILISILLFIFGTLLSLYVSSNLLWGEMEALLFAPQIDSRHLALSCPLLIAPNESATISTTVSNNTDEAKTPQVNAFFSKQGDMQVDTQTLQLDSYSKQLLQWRVNSSNLVFDRLILVSIVQRPYKDLEAHQGQCSVYVYNLFGLSGKNSLISIYTVSVIFSLAGLWMMNQFLKPLSERTKKMMNVNLLFLVLVMLGLFSALPRLWGLTLFFNATALLSVCVAYVEILFSKK